jgi:hypothetical protein
MQGINAEVWSEQVPESEWDLEDKSAQEAPRAEIKVAAGLPLGSNDAAIINLTNELAKRFGLSKTFSTVAWETGFVRKNRGRYATMQPTTFVPMPADTPTFRDHTIYLARNMESQLSTDDWKPLIASALINRWKLRTRKFGRILAITVPVIAVYVAGWILLPPMYPTVTHCGPPYTHSYGTCAIDNQAWNLLVPLGLFLWIPLLIASLISLRPLFNASTADRETAEMFGRDNIVYSLRKVSEVSPSDAWRVQRRIGRLTQRDEATT